MDNNQMAVTFMNKSSYAGDDHILQNKYINNKIPQKSKELKMDNRILNGFNM